MRKLLIATLLAGLATPVHAQNGFSVQQDREILGAMKAASVLCGINTDYPQRWVEFQLTAIAMRRGWNGAQMNPIGWLEARPVVDPYRHATPAQKRKFEPQRRKLCQSVLKLRAATRAMSG